MAEDKKNELPGDMLVNPDADLPEILLRCPYIIDEKFTDDMWQTEATK